MNIPAYDSRFIPCYKCAFMGNRGTDSRGLPIAWCHLQHEVVAPEIGCRDAKLIVPTVREEIHLGDYVENLEGTVGGTVTRITDTLIVFVDENESIYRMSKDSVARRKE